MNGREVGGGRRPKKRSSRSPLLVFKNRSMVEAIRERLAEGPAEERLQALNETHRRMVEGEIGSESAISLLVGALSDSDSLVRRHAVGVMAADRETIRGLLISLQGRYEDTRMLSSALIFRALVGDPGLWKTNNPTDEEVNEACTILFRTLIGKEERMRMEACGSLCRLAQRSPFLVLDKLQNFIRRELSGLHMDRNLNGRIARIDFDARKAMERRD